MRSQGTHHSLSKSARYLQGYHFATTSFHTTLPKRSMHQKSALSLNLTKRSNQRSNSKYRDTTSARQEIHGETDISELAYKTKMLTEIFLSRELVLVEDIENDQSQMTSLESYLKTLTHSVKAFKEALTFSMAARSRLAQHNRPPSTDQPSHLLANSHRQVPKEKLQNVRVVDQVSRFNTQSPSSLSASNLRQVLDSSLHHSMIARTKKANNNLSLDSYAKMNMSHPTISDH